MSNSCYVVDTCALISYYSSLFKDGSSSISDDSINLIDKAFYSSEIKLIFPSTVFIEIFEKWYTSDEQAAKLTSEIYTRIKNRENMEIQPLDREILENFIQITDIEKDYNFDNHDKQILAAAITMKCPLITSDQRIVRYNERKKIIKILS